MGVKGFEDLWEKPIRASALMISSWRAFTRVHDFALVHLGFAIREILGIIGKYTWIKQVLGILTSGN